MEEKEREERSLPRSAERDRAAPLANLKGAEDEELHRKVLLPRDAGELQGF
jgi:hypothetical protein